MNLPEQPESRLASAVAGAIAAAGASRAILAGDLAPAVLESVFAHLDNSAGDITVVDNVWDAISLPFADNSCAWMISGITCYHAMYDQLYAVRAACRMQRTPTLIVIPQLPNALAWRDHYEDPEAVPGPWRHQTEPCIMDGRTMYRSLSSGGPHNGVLPAIEDFIAEAKDEGVHFASAQVRALNGLYVLFDANAPWALRLARCILQLRGREAGSAMRDPRLRSYIAGLNAKGSRSRKRKE